jgi:hypothetical protein
METEDQLCRRYEVELVAFAALDRRYYLSSCPTLADRDAYATRQERLEPKRYQFYAELKRNPGAHAPTSLSLSPPTICSSPFSLATTSAHSKQACQMGQATLP